MDDMNDASVAEVEEQLGEYLAQHNKVVQDLKQNPDDEDLLYLQTELETVIELTHEILQMKKKELGIKREAERADLKVLNNPQVRLDTDEGEKVTPSVVPAPEKPYTPKRLVIQPIPKSLTIQPDDPADVVRKKKKKIHMIKSQNRAVQAELERNEKKESWQSFIQGSGKKRKKSLKGINPKRESIFKSPDSVDGKVGVTGSGKAVTENPLKRPKFSKSGVQGQDVKGD